MRLLRHPRIYLDATGRTSDALLFDNGEVVAVGDQAQARHETGPVFEPEAACLFPALADAHCHLWGLGRRAGSVELSKAEHSNEVIEALRRLDPTELPTEWVMGRGWDDHTWPSGDELKRSDLDELYPDRPVCLHRVDNHAVVVNTEAMHRAGLWSEAHSEAASTIEGGELELDDDGTPTGRLIDGAMEPILETIPDPDLAEDRRMFREAAARYRRLGMASAHLAKVDPERLEMLFEMEQSGELPLRLYVMIDGDKASEEIFERGPIHDDAARLSIGAIKQFADGALGSGGAHLLEPDREGSTGLEVTPPDVLGRRADYLADRGWQMAVHAIGDRAARHVLDAFERISATRRRRLRPRLEHAQMLASTDLERLESLSTIASIQPIHLRSDAAWADERLTDEQLERLFPWRTLESQTTLAAGSDFPIEDPNPWHGIATAITRRDARGRCFQPERSLSRSSILAAYTMGAARAAHWEDCLGRLDPGYRADCVALSCDPLRDDPETIWETEVRAMWLGGTPIDTSHPSDRL